MQQPAGVIDMMTACNEKTISPAPCEKRILLRNAILLPKNVHPYLSRSSVSHSIAMLVPILTGIGIKRGNMALYSPADR